MSDSKIEWTDATWNPVRGCSRVSEGCRNCYAERQSARFEKGYANGFVRDGKWTGRVELVEDKLLQPLLWRLPRRVFVNSMSDLFHERLSDDAIDRVFAVMALAPHHTFQVLTKRPARMRDYFQAVDVQERIAIAAVRESKALRGTRADQLALDAIASAVLWGNSIGSRFEPRGFRTWPLPNVWLGISVEDQQTADERVPMLIQSPAAVRFVSCEPMLEAIDFSRAGAVWPLHRPWTSAHRTYGEARAAGALGTYQRQALVAAGRTFVDWIIVGGESGPSARPCNLEWIRDVVVQCEAARVPCFVKQVGSDPWASTPRPLANAGCKPTYAAFFRHPKGGDPDEWPEDLRVREFPA